jgi:deazaflavin-dependent oxidoreductase (nitroreductase family)
VDAALVLEEPGDVKALLKLVTFVALALGAVGAVFLSGMRSKSPLVLNAVRRTGRATKGFVLPRAGIAGSAYAVIRHVGRKSGRVYETPMQPVKTDDGFAVALPYGRNTDWLKNVLAAGRATLVFDGETYEIDRPEVVAMRDANGLFSEREQRIHDLFRVEDCLLVKLATR